jgi:hypothetical protein
MTEAASSASPYKVVEITEVTDTAIEEVLNRWNDKGYRVDSVHFVTQPGNRRPSMAFLFLVRRGAGA